MEKNIPAMNKNNAIKSKFVVKTMMFGAMTLAMQAPVLGFSAPVPSYVPPVALSETPDYADHSRGVFVPSHEQYRLMSQSEMDSWGAKKSGYPSLADGKSETAQVSQLAGQAPTYDQQLNRIATDPGLLVNPPQERQQSLQAIAQYDMQQTPGGLMVPQGYPAVPQQQYVMPQQMQTMPQVVVQPIMVPQTMPVQQQAAGAPVYQADPAMGGVEVSKGRSNGSVLDMHNSLVRLKEDRLTIRRALQRMMDQIGAGDWVVVWDLAEGNAALPETEISIHAEEPFMTVLNALLARMQARSGQPLRVVRYDRTQRLVVTDRPNGSRLAGEGGSSASSIGINGAQEAAITESVLKETMVSLHYDEVPLVDALENVVHQAGKGQWKLRIYAGVDQVLKPAHIEEPFAIAMERLLKLFNLKYEIFPGGKMIVITQNNRFGFTGMGETK